MKMVTYKVCKYDLSNASYAEEWSTVWEALEESPHEYLSDDYLETEKYYLEVIINFIEKYHSYSLKLENVEINFDESTKTEFLKVSRGLTDYDIDIKNLSSGKYHLIDMLNFYQKALRNFYWGELTASNGIKLSISNDYYLLLTIPGSDDISELVNNELNVYRQD